MNPLTALVRAALHRPRLVVLMALWAAACALLGLADLRIDLLPSLAPAEAIIETDAPGLVAEQVEQTVTRPLESALVGTMGVARVRSRSIQGLSVIQLRFVPGADPLKVRQLVAADLARADALPAGASTPRLEPLTAAGSQVMAIGFTSDKLDAMALRDVVQWTVRPRLLSVPGVGRVTLHGGRERRIEVHARPGDLSDSDLGFLDILNATRRATSVAGAGFIDTPNQRVLIEPHGQALTTDQVGAGQIQTPGADPVRIDDVADVVEAPAPAFGDALINGKPGVVLDIDHQLGANTLQTSQAVDRALAVLAPSLAAQGVVVSSDLDRPADFIDRALRGLAADLLIGLGLAVVVLLAFMRDVRAVLISLVSLPLTFLASLLVIKAVGWSLNAMTLGGLVVALGMVLDDAVIDVENILATLRDAEARHASRLLAVLSASLEVRAPVVKAAAPVIAVLAPLLLLKGPEGVLLAPLAGAVIVALITSLVVALTVTPALCLLLLQHIRPAPEHPRWRRTTDRQVAWLRRVGPKPWPVLIVAGVAVLIAAVGAAFLRPELLPSVADGQLVVTADAPVGSAPAVVSDLGARLSGDLMAVKGVRSVVERIGRDANGDDATAIEHGRFDVALDPGLGARGQSAVRRTIADRLARYPGLDDSLSTRFDDDRTGEDTAPLSIGVYGSDLDQIDRVAGGVAQALSAVPGGGVIGSPDSARAPVMRADVNFSKLALFGLSSADVLDTVQAAFAGETVGRIYDGPRVVDLAISAQDQLRRDPEAVGDLLLRSTSGISEPLKSVANVYLTDGRAVIVHENGLRERRILAHPRPGDLEHFTALARAATTRQVAPPPGVFLEFSQDDPAKGVRRRLAADYALAALAVFALLALAFDGRTALLILAAPLLAFVGGVIAVALMGGVLSIGAIVGFVALLGLSIRAAILLISQVEDRVLRDHAAWSLDTVIAASRDRSSALVITALLVAVSVAPLALQAGQAGREILGPMSIVILGGLVTGTLGDLLILPVLTFVFWRPGYARWSRRWPPTLSTAP